MFSSKDDSSCVIGWLETYVSASEIMTVHVNGNISTVMKRDRRIGKVESKTYFGKPPLPSAFEANKK